MPNAKISQSDTTLAQLVGIYMPYIRKKAAGIKGSPLETDDLVQEGLIGLVGALNSYDARRGAEFSTYAHTCINNSISSALKAAARFKHRPLNCSLSLTDENIGSIPPAPSAEDQAISNEDFCVLQNIIGHSLSAFEKRVLELRLNSRSNIEIASTLGVTVKSVSNAVDRARRKLKEYMPK